MHMADALFSPEVGGSIWAVTAGCNIFNMARTRSSCLWGCSIHSSSVMDDPSSGLDHRSRRLLSYLSRSAGHRRVVKKRMTELSEMVAKF